MANDVNATAVQKAGKLCLGVNFLDRGYDGARRRAGALATQEREGQRQQQRRACASGSILFSFKNKSRVHSETALRQYASSSHSKDGDAVSKLQVTPLPQFS